MDKNILKLSFHYFISVLLVCIGQGRLFTCIDTREHKQPCAWAEFDMYAIKHKDSYG